MDINRNNYEICIVDYFDGRLQPEEVTALMLFLNQNPDLKEEFETFNCSCLDTDDSCLFTQKEILKKEINPTVLINEENYLHYFFDDIEGNSSPELRQEVLEFMAKNPALQRSYELLKLTRLEAEDIIFPHKDALKKSIVIPLQRRRILWSAVAAAIFFLLVAGSTLLIFLGNKQGSMSPLAGHDTFANSGKQINNTSEIIMPDVPLMIADDDITQQHLWEKNQEQVAEKLPPRLAVPETMTLHPQVASLPLPSSRHGSAKHITEYTDIMESIAQRQELQGIDRADEKMTITSHNKQESYADGNADQPSEKRGFNFWALAELGVAGYNALAANDVKYSRETDDDGKTRSVELGKIAYSRKR